MNPRSIVWVSERSALRLSGRTVRSLRAAGCQPEVAGDAADFNGPMLIAQAGAWLRHPAALHLPESSGVIALGSDGSREWSALLRRCGGDFSRLRHGWKKPRLPRVPVFFISDASAVGGLVHQGLTLPAALERLVFGGQFRVVRLPSLDAEWSESPRVLQVVTTIQTGGAERVTLDLAAGLNQAGIATAVAALGHPGRATLPEPPHFANLADGPNTAQGRADRVHSAALEWGADLVHAHLIRADDARAIKARGIPLVMTLHNTRPGWPAGMEAATEETADLLLACAQCVEREMAPLTSVPVRTVWNGIVTSRFERTPERIAAALALRSALAIPAAAPVLLVLANPRPQKRMDRLPAALARLPGAHLLIAGEPPPNFMDETGRLREAFHAAGVSPRVHWLGVRRDVSVVLAAADALLSLSGWEGLSLAHLEALAANIPVIATDAGGTREIAQRHPGLTLLPLEAGAEEIASAVRDRLATTAPHAFPRCFTSYHMARRTARLYSRVLAGKPARPASARPRLWLVTNNFSTGGAQSSARRLLLALAGQGIDVRAAVVQENPRHPTPGRRALIDAGIPVFAAPPPEASDAADACEALLDEMDAHPPAAVVFWNLITSYKLHLADLLLHTRVFDVSPGGMYFSSMEQYFAAPRPDLPYTTARDYGARLAGMVVKYAREAPRAADYLGAPVAVIPNGIALPGPPMPRAPRDPRFTIATAARLSPDKCLPELLAALRLAAPQLPPWRLRIAGGGERDHRGYVRELRRMARGLPVEWCGPLSDMRPFLAAADLFVMISEPAGCPNASLEALAAGLPVIATDVGGASEQILDGQTGILCPPADPAALAAAILTLARDPAQRTRLAENGRAHVSSVFSLDRMTESYRQLLLNQGDRALA